MAISQINAASIASGTIVTSDIAANTVTPAILTIGGPFWNSANQVGIGTTTPGYQLDVQGTTGIVSTKSTTGTNTSYFISNNNGGATAVGIDSSAGTLTGTANASFLWSSVNSPIIFSQNSTERMRIDASGNIGIGTNTPSNFGRLAIINSSGNQISFGTSSSQNNTGYLTYDSTGGGLTLNAYSTGGSTFQAFYTSNSGTNAERMRINSSGYVGIGTSSPSFPLDVYGSGGAAIRGGQGFNLYNSDNTNNYYMYNAGSSGSGNANLLIVQGGVAERMRITSGGVVAIGRTSAYSSEVLSVQGNIGVVMPGGSGSYPTIQFYNTNGVLRGAKDGAGAGVDGLQLWQSSTVNIGVYPSNVGIGTTSPGSFGATQIAFTAIQSTSAGAETMALCLVNNSSSTSTAVSLGFAPNINVDLARITALRTDSGYGGATDLLFKFWDGSNATEKFRIKNTGTLQLTNSSAVINNSNGNPMLKQTGGILQVVQTVLPGLFSTSSTTMVDVTGLSVSITPSSSSSKFYVQVTLFGFPSLYTSFANIVRVVGGTSTNLLQATTAGVRPVASISFSQDPTSNGPTNTLTQAVLDSPATSSAITYKVQASGRPDGQSGQFLNIGASATDRNTNSYDPRGSSSITVWEIAG
jgi:hypothetical protein